METFGKNREIIKTAVTGSLATIEQEREREIVSRRLGLGGKKQTLEQIGTALDITRERVRQLEKSIVMRLKINAEEGRIAPLNVAEKLLIRTLTEMGRVARLDDLARTLFDKPTIDDVADLAFLSVISAQLTDIKESDTFYRSIGIAEYGTAKEYQAKADEIIKVIGANKEPMSADQLDEKLDYQHPSHITAVASISKKLATLNGLWGLSKWPSVNPRNIRDKIFVVLSEAGEPLHFDQIAERILSSSFNHKVVTKQAIHNELIKDDRFVLIGRGIYALATWGYEKGTVSDIIVRYLKEQGTPIERDKIINHVLRLRQVKATTVLLNLQNRELFAKVGKNQYQLAQK
ncbi:hypothetical protein FWH13_02155 [Candidatus Saccharibacteria bacterium]|nr:hypothetical protein [Candidatus Saccharibacteria bacterium]